MADNIQLNAGSGGDTVAADEISSVKYQRVKITLGADGTNDGDASSANPLPVAGNVAHDDPDAGRPVKVGMKAAAHGTSPAAVAAADRVDWLASRHGVPWVIGGHPNIVTSTARVADSDGAQSDAAIGPGAVAAGLRLVVTRLTVAASKANTSHVAAKVGFGAATLPADALAGAAGVLFDHEGIAAGDCVTVGDGSGILGVGGDGEELRLTCDDPAGGHLTVSASYYAIES